LRAARVALEDADDPGVDQPQPEDAPDDERSGDEQVREDDAGRDGSDGGNTDAGTSENEDLRIGERRAVEFAINEFGVDVSDITVIEAEPVVWRDGRWLARNRVICTPRRWWTATGSCSRSTASRSTTTALPVSAPNAATPTNRLGRRADGPRLVPSVPRGREPTVPMIDVRSVAPGLPPRPALPESPRDPASACSGSLAT